MLNTSPSGFLHPLNDGATFDDSEDERRAFFEKMWQSPGFSKLISNYKDLLFDPAANATWCEFVAEKIRSLVEDPETAEKLIPKDHRFGEKRPPFVTGYYEAYNNPNVSLVDLEATPILRLTPDGIETADGVQRVRHRRVGDRLRLRHRRAPSHGDPGPGRPGAGGPLGRRPDDVPRRLRPPASRTSSSPVGRTRRPATTRGTTATRSTSSPTRSSTRETMGYDTIEVDPAAEERWTDMVNRYVDLTSFTEKSYYYGTNIPGKPRKLLLNSGGRPKLFKEIARVVETDYKAFRLSRSVRRGDRGQG